MGARIADYYDVATRAALALLIKELEKRGLKLESAARIVYRKKVITALRREPRLLETYSAHPVELEGDIKVFVANMMKIRREKAIRVPSVDAEQLSIAFAKCGPHRLRC